MGQKRPIGQASELNGDISVASLQEKHNLFRRIILVIHIYLNFLFQVPIAVMQKLVRFQSP